MSFRTAQEFTASELGQRYPAVVRTWQAAWSEFTPYLAFPPEIRKVVFPTNLIESINARLRKTTRNRGHFPSEQAVLKVLYLAVRELIIPKASDINHVAAHWKKALNQFSLFLRGPDQHHIGPKDLHKDTDSSRQPATGVVRLHGRW
ncbi:transposase [Streptomyces sp. DSM 41602]|uniref:Mutator family transposase n=1 Tax=Streptomyces antimycoticus TaxID=68175 RepID=A0ABD5JMS3_9ACTN|nr:transposase [Streptomyces sp. DSM 41602]